MKYFGLIAYPFLLTLILYLFYSIVKLAVKNALLEYDRDKQRD